MLAHCTGDYRGLSVAGDTRDSRIWVQGLHNRRKRPKSLHVAARGDL
jgi:hypothetical protein